MEKGQEIVPIDKAAIRPLPGENQGWCLIGGRCLSCGRYFFPKREICPQCFDRGRVEETVLSCKGILVSYTVIHRAIDKNVPYAVGYVKVPENMVIFAPLEIREFSDLSIGMEMEVAFSEEETADKLKWMVYKFRPAS